jgi:hypothetical protein
MKIQALNIQSGDRIVAYFKNKMQICTVRGISTADRSYIKLSVFLGEHYRYSSSGIIQFKSEAIVDLVNSRSQV